MTKVSSYDEDTNILPARERTTNDHQEDCQTSAEITEILMVST